MRHLLSILASLLLCSAPLHAQTLKSLMFNSTNGQVVANTGTNVLTFTNNIKFGNGDLSVIGQAISGSGVSLSFEDGNFTGILYMDGGEIQFANAATTRANLGFSTNLNTLWTATNASNARSAVGLGATWLTNTNVANVRTDIGLPLAALTNTSNVTAMRALSGSTNTNEPYSGSISVVGTNNTNTLVFSNGILQSVQ